MSEDKTPEWVRVARELRSLIEGVWENIHHLTDRLHFIERRVERLERDLDQSNIRPLDRRHSMRYHRKREDSNPNAGDSGER